MILLQDLPFKYSLAQSVPASSDVACQILDTTDQSAFIEIFATTIAADVTGTHIGLYEIAEIVEEYCRTTGKSLLRITVRAGDRNVYTDTVLYHDRPMGNVSLRHQFLTYGPQYRFCYEGTQDFLYFLVDIEEETPHTIDVTFLTTFGSGAQPVMHLGAEESTDKSAMHIAAETSPFVCQAVGSYFLCGIELCYLLEFVREHNEKLRANWNGRSENENSPMTIYNSIAPDTCTDSQGANVSIRGIITGLQITLGHREFSIYLQQCPTKEVITSLYYQGTFGLREVLHTPCPVTITSKTERTQSEGFDPTDGHRVTRSHPSVREESTSLKFILPTAALYRTLYAVSESPTLWVSRYGFHHDEDPAALPLLAAPVVCDNTTATYDDRSGQPQTITFNLTRARPTGVTMAELLLS